MRIYKPLGTRNYECINTVNDEDYDIFDEFDGRSRALGWNPIRVRRVRADHRQGFKASDFPWLGGHALIMRVSAVSALRDILDASGELLPLDDEGGESLFVFNAQVVPALDRCKSQITYFPGSTRIMYVDTPVFYPATVVGLDIFRTDYRAAPTYVSERFVQRVNSAKLKGLDFDVVWESPDYVP